MSDEPRDDHVERQDLDDEPEAGLPPRGETDSDSDLDDDPESDGDRADGGDEGDRPRADDGPDRLHGLIGYILGQIVSKPEEVKIELAENDKRRVYEVRVAADDVGVVIGRSGRTINAIRTLLRGVPDAPERVWVELIEEDEGRGRRSRRDGPRERFDEEPAESDDGVSRDVAGDEPGDDRGYDADRADRGARDDEPDREDRNDRDRNDRGLDEGADREA